MTLAEQAWKKAEEARNRLEQIRHHAAEEKRDLTPEETEQMKLAATDFHKFHEDAKAHLEADKVDTIMDGIKEYPLFGEQKTDKQPEKKTSPDGAKVFDGVPYSEEKAFHAFIRNGQISQGLKFANEVGFNPDEQKAMGTISDTAGGVLISTQLANYIIKKKIQLDDLKRRCTVLPNVIGNFEIPTFINTDSPAAIAEASALSETAITDFGKTTLEPHEFGLEWRIHNNLLSDAPTVESFLGGHFGERSANYEDDLILNGTGGNSNPWGLLNVTFNSVNDITGSSDNIAPEDFRYALGKLTAPYRRNAVYIVPNLTYLKILGFRTDEGGGGTGSFLFQPAYQLGAPDILNGKPLIESTNFSDPSSDGDAMFLCGDLSTYYWADRQGVMIMRDPYSLSSYRQTKFILTFRADGTPTDIYAFVRYDRK